MLRDELESYLADLLSVDDFNDYCPNGLQVEGGDKINKLICGVTASQALIDDAIRKKADAILVHHGYFWKGEDPAIRHLKKQRIQSLLENNISLFAYHLPLDAHSTFGNNVQLANLLGFQVEKALEKHGKHDLGLVCRLESEMTIEQLSNVVNAQLGREPTLLGPKNKRIQRVALCTGAAQSMFLGNYRCDA